MPPFHRAQFAQDKQDLHRGRSAQMRLGPQREADTETCAGATADVDQLVPKCTYWQHFAVLDPRICPTESAPADTYLARSRAGGRPLIGLEMTGRTMVLSRRLRGLQNLPSAFFTDTPVLRSGTVVGTERLVPRRHLLVSNHREVSGDPLMELAYLAATGPRVPTAEWAPIVADLINFFASAVAPPAYGDTAAAAEREELTQLVDLTLQEIESCGFASAHEYIALQRTVRRLTLEAVDIELDIEDAADDRAFGRLPVLVRRYEAKQAEVDQDHAMAQTILEACARTGPMGPRLAAQLAYASYLAASIEDQEQVGRRQTLEAAFARLQPEHAERLGRKLERRAIACATARRETLLVALARLDLDPNSKIAPSRLAAPGAARAGKVQAPALGPNGPQDFLRYVEGLAPGKHALLPFGMSVCESGSYLFSGSGFVVFERRENGFRLFVANPHTEPDAFNVDRAIAMLLGKKSKPSAAYLEQLQGLSARELWFELGAVAGVKAPESCLVNRVLTIRDVEDLGDANVRDVIITLVSQFAHAQATHPKERRRDGPECVAVAAAVQVLEGAGQDVVLPDQILRRKWHGHQPTLSVRRAFAAVRDATAYLLALSVGERDPIARLAEIRLADTLARIRASATSLPPWFLRDAALVDEAMTVLRPVLSSHSTDREVCEAARLWVQEQGLEWNVVVAYFEDLAAYYQRAVKSPTKAFARLPSDDLAIRAAWVDGGTLPMPPKSRPAAVARGDVATVEHIAEDALVAEPGAGDGSGSLLPSDCGADASRKPSARSRPALDHDSGAATEWRTVLPKRSAAYCPAFLWLALDDLPEIRVGDRSFVRELSRLGYVYRCATDDRPLHISVLERDVRRIGFHVTYEVDGDARNNVHLNFSLLDEAERPSFSAPTASQRSMLLELHAEVWMRLREALLGGCLRHYQRARQDDED